MLSVHRDGAGNRHISVFGGNVRIVEQQEGARFRVTVGSTTMEVPANVTDLAWQNGYGRIEYKLTNVSCEGRGKQACWIIRFKKRDGGADWNAPGRPQTRVWLTVAIPLSEDIEPWFVHSCALPETGRRIESYFGVDFWSADIVGQIREESRQQHYGLRRVALHPFSWLLILVGLVALPFAVISVVFALLLALVFSVVLGLIAGAMTIWQRLRNRRY